MNAAQRNARLRGSWVALLFGAWISAGVAADYFPPRGEWASCDPRACQLDLSAVQTAVEELQRAESSAPRDQYLSWSQSFGQREPWFDGVLGPMAERGPVSGLLIHRGLLGAQWGEPERVDMAHSVTKSFLSAVVGLAWQDRLIASVEAPVAASMPRDVELFSSDKNAAINWDQLLRQTSDWQGSLWGKPDWADRPSGVDEAEWRAVPRHPPGSHYEYNDVRINVLALAALQVWRSPLPQVLRERIMDPIGASPRWRWHGYRNAWVEIDGQHMQSVSGGGHWGGGMFIDAWDMARFGYLYLRNGRWRDPQLIDRRWIAMSRQPGSANPNYGYANWFLNTERKALPSAPASAVYFVGNGMNVIYIDWDHDLVVVARWIKDQQALDRFVAQVLAADTKPNHE